MKLPRGSRERSMAAKLRFEVRRVFVSSRTLQRSSS
jgi:hypothetical protein